MSNNRNSEPSYDNRGRPNGEARPEHHAKRPFENPPNGKKSSSGKAVSKTSNKVNSILDGKSSMPMPSDPQSMQKQIDVCLDFCDGIDVFVGNCKLGKEYIKNYVDDAQQAQSFAELIPHMRQYQQNIEELLVEMQKLLEMHQEGFKIVITSTYDQMNLLNLKPKLTNVLKTGLRNQTNKMANQRPKPNKE